MSSLVTNPNSRWFQRWHCWHALLSLAGLLMAAGGCQPAGTLHRSGVTESPLPPTAAARTYRDQAIADAKNMVPATRSIPAEAEIPSPPVVQTSYRDNGKSTPATFRSPVVVHVSAPSGSVATVVAKNNKPVAEQGNTKVANPLVIVPAEPIKNQVELRMSLAPVAPVQKDPHHNVPKSLLNEGTPVAVDSQIEGSAEEKSILVRRKTQLAAPVATTVESPAPTSEGAKKPTAVVQAAPEVTAPVVTSMVAVEPEPAVASLPRLRLTAETLPPSVAMSTDASHSAVATIRELPSTAIPPAPSVHAKLSPTSAVVAASNRQPAQVTVPVPPPASLAAESPQRPSVAMAVPPREPAVRVTAAPTQAKEVPPAPAVNPTPRVSADVTPRTRDAEKVRLDTAPLNPTSEATVPVSPLIVAAPRLRKFTAVPAPERQSAPAKPPVVEPKVDQAPAPQIQIAASQPQQRQMVAGTANTAHSQVRHAPPIAAQTPAPPVARPYVASQPEGQFSRETPAVSAPAPYAAPAVTARPQNSALVSVSQRVHQQVRYAFSLAGRGATHSARMELTDALKLVAMAQDADEGTTRHNEAMMAGLTAMREADDFAVRDSQSDLRIDVERLISTHKTPILKNGIGPAPSPIEALQAYYGYARQQLVIAGGHEIGASMALYGMARIQMAIGGQQGMNGPKAMTLHQAALAVDANNYLAANELGVLLARYGQLNEAEASLRHSVAISPQPETWRNLAEVHRRQGQVRLEAEARRRGDEQLAARRSGRVPNPTASGIVDWVDPATFVAMTDASPGGVPVSEIAAAAAVATPPNPAAAAVSASQSKSWSLPESIRGLTSRIGQNPKR